MKYRIRQIGDKTCWVESWEEACNAWNRVSSLHTSLAAAKQALKFRIDAREPPKTVFEIDTARERM
jgi:hypothetical protein